jgi:hypothetical protein
VEHGSASVLASTFETLFSTGNGRLFAQRDVAELTTGLAT